MPGSLDPDDGGQQLLLGKMLLERGLITPDQLREALVERARNLSDGAQQAMPLGGILVRKGYLTDEQLHGLISEQESNDAPSPFQPPPEPPPAPQSAAPASSSHLAPASSSRLPAPQSSTRLQPVVSGPSLPAIAATDNLQAGSMLGKYRLVRELGRGGMGVVFEAVDTQLNRKVALKLMLTNPNADPKERALEEERFVQEAQLSAKLKHPNIVTVYEAGLLEGRQFLSMEMIEGQAFSDWRKTVTIRDQIRVLADVSGAVHHAHEQGILHRDLKPRNILVSASGHSYVTDFGLAKSLGKNVHHSLTGSGAVVGTPAYMSPEQAQGLDRVDWRTDIYSLGVILYECMTGRTPFTGESPIEILMKVVKDPVTPPLQVVDSASALGLDKAIENICLKALAKKDRDRYVTAQAFADDLMKWLAGEKVHVVAPKAPSKPGSRRVYVLTGLLFLVLISGLVFLGMKSAKPSVRLQLEAAARYMAEEKFAEALIEYRVALATDSGNLEAVMGAKNAQEGIARKERERDERLKNEVIDKFKELEQKQLEAAKAREREREAASDEERQRLAEESRKAEEAAKAAAQRAAKAEEDFRRTQVLVYQPPGTVDEWKESINLLPIIDPRRNAVAGTWENAEAGRLVSDRSPYARVEIPFQLPQEYDFRLVFERRSGAGGVTVILSRGGRQFRCEIGGDANTRSSFENLKSSQILEYPATAQEPVVLLNDQLYTLVVQVRADGVKASLNTKPLLEWKTDFADIGLNPRWKLRNTLRLGVGSHECETQFHRMELLEVNGLRGRKLEPPPLAAFKAPSVIPSQLKPGLLGEYYLGTNFQSLAARRIDPTIDFRWNDGAAWPGGPADSFSCRWSGFLHVSQSRRYLFSVVADDGVRVFIDDQQVLGAWNSRTEGPRNFECLLDEGYHKLVVEYFELAWMAGCVLQWTSNPAQPAMPITMKSFFHSASDPGNYMAPKPPELLNIVSGRRQNVTALSFDPSGKMLAVAGEDKIVKILDAATQRESGAGAHHPAGVLSVAYSPDHITFATGTRDLDKKIRVWDAQNRTELRTLEGPTASIQCLAFSPGEGKRLAVGSYDWSVRLWTLDSNDDPLMLSGHTGGVESLAFRPDGKILATGGLDKTLRTWDVETGKLLLTLKGHADSVSSVAFTPGGRTIASASADGLIKLWDSDSGQLLRVLAGHGDEVVCIAFSSDGQLLAAGGNDGMLRIWDPVQGRLMKTLPGHTSRITCVAFSPAGRVLASGSADTTVRVWNLDR
ncbi:MAG TPA: protein kinase [Planctomycetota bacterium]|nr:protein kinase [Planctomycetota bacterium]